MKNGMRILWLLLFAALIALIIQQATAQTRADATMQLKKLPVSPIASVQRWECVNTGNVDCVGLQMIKLVLADGTTLGPYVGVQASPTTAALGVWQTIPLATPDPPGPLAIKNN